MEIYIVEDDEWYSQFLSHHLNQNPDFSVKVFSNGKSVLKALKEGNIPSLITLDYHLPDVNGESLMKEIFSITSLPKIIVVTEEDDLRLGIKLVKQGAYDYLAKGAETAQQLWIEANKVKKLDILENKVTELNDKIHKIGETRPSIIGNSETLKDSLKNINLAAKTNINVSITGETGTGKELIAKEVFNKATSYKKNLIITNIASLSENIIESELFGHEKGAFTGASETRKGLLEMAHQGTLFLDEIGELPIGIQIKLLRCLQEKRITRVGGNKEIKCDFRLITATHKNLSEEVEKGNVREDFYFRIKGLEIKLPPLRKRKEDILLLADHFADQFCLTNNLKKKSFSAEAKKSLLTYSFPGNIRELKSIIDLACVLADQMIENNHLQFSEIPLSEKIFGSVRTLKEYEMLIIQHFLNKYNNNVQQVAELLDIGKSTIYRILKQENYKNLEA